MSTTTQDKTKLQSLTIDFLRFPLIMMVVFIHMSPKTINLIDAKYSLLSGHGIYNIIKILFSHTITSIAVPTFFLISGFLFFSNFQDWSWKGYQKKIGSRIKTLLIPYILWNLIPFLLIVGKCLIGDISNGNPTTGTLDFFYNNIGRIFYVFHEWESSSTDWLGNHLYSTAPLNVPLWFVRDLFVISLLTPIIYLAVTKINIWLILALFFAYISKIWTQIPGLDIESIFYFTVGAFFAINKINFVEFADKYKYYLLPTSAILLVACTIYDGNKTEIGHNIIPFYICTSILSVFYLASTAIDRYNIKPNKFLVSACFFIYVSHVMPLPNIECLLTFVKKTIHEIIPGKSLAENYFCYFATPIITAFISIVIFAVLRKISPKATKFICGNR